MSTVSKKLKVTELKRITVDLPADRVAGVQALFHLAGGTSRKNFIEELLIRLVDHPDKSRIIKEIFQQKTLEKKA